MTADARCSSCESKGLSHCIRCSNGDKCESCDYNVAILNTNTGKCDICRSDNGWVKDSSTGKCSCPMDKYTDIKGGGFCKTCDQLIDGCQECERTDITSRGVLTKLIGYNSHLSNAKGKYVKCNKAGPGLVQVNNQLKLCTSHIPGCLHD